MHPPFYTPDTYVSHDITVSYTSRPKTRRGLKPQRLSLLPMPGWPPVYPDLTDEVPPASTRLPSGRPVEPKPYLAVVPAPRSTLRDMLGRFLIRTGQRMILQNGPS